MFDILIQTPQTETVTSHKPRMAELIQEIVAIRFVLSYVNMTEVPDIKVVDYITEQITPQQDY